MHEEAARLWGEAWLGGLRFERVGSGWHGDVGYSVGRSRCEFRRALQVEQWVKGSLFGCAA